MLLPGHQQTHIEHLPRARVCAAHFILSTVVGGRDLNYCRFAHEETGSERLKNLPEVSQGTINGTWVWVQKGSFNHQMVLPF